MKVLRYYSPGDVRIEESPRPVPGPGEVTVRVRACSVCGTDLKISRYGHHRIRPPRVLGHEIAGEVAQFGEGVRGWAVGDRVQVIAAIPCGWCADCRAGRLSVCPAQKALGYDYDGGFAEYLRVPSKVLAVGGLNRIPGSVGFGEASLAEPLACVLNGQELAGVGQGDVVVVAGCGPVGCLHVRLARARGATKVFLTGAHHASLRRAAERVEPDQAVCAEDGDVADQVLGLTAGRGADVVIIAVSSWQAYGDALRYAARRGRISLFSSLPDAEATTAIDPNLVHYRELAIVGATGSSPAQNSRALELIASGSVPVTDLITHRLPIDRFPEAMEIRASGSALKVTVEP
jgi:L-iditol 2-dehydrogenase